MGVRHSLAVAIGVSCFAVAGASNHVQATDSRSSGSTPQRSSGQTSTPAATRAAKTRSPQRALVDQYCVGCHNTRLKSGGLALDTLDVDHVGEGAEAWETVVRKLRGGLMPPVGRPRPEPAAYDGFAAWLETELDRAAAARPNPGRTETFHRLNRTEYHNAIRDLLALEVDVTSLLPVDGVGYGFDNNAGVLKVNDVLMEQYLSAARKISREAVGAPLSSPVIRSFAVKETERQDQRRDGLPFGTRGGILVRYNVPQDGEYVIKVELFEVNSPDRHELEVAIDGERVKLFTFEPGLIAGRQAKSTGDLNAPDLQLRLPIKAGPREISVAFLKLPSTTEVEAPRARFERPFVAGSYAGLQDYLAVRQPSVSTVTIAGPYGTTAPGDTPSRRRIFECRPSTTADEPGCAKKILASLARRAYRRPVADADLQPLLTFYDQRRANGETFEAGVELALRRLLVSPEFLFRGEAEPGAHARVNRVAANAAGYRISDLELASRLSFFLWSSIPDDQLLDLAARGRLGQPATLDAQVARMLADRRADSLVNNFVGQWLFVRNLRVVTPSVPIFPNFDERLRVGFQKETELFFKSILRENRSVLDLLRADYTFVDERLAAHYGIPNVKGSDFRRVMFNDGNPRRGLGLLGHGSILTVTSRPNRTSPVIRGTFILDVLLGTPSPPPPPDVPPLKETTEVLGGNQFMARPTMRDRMAQHRANPACAGCHAVIDPLGFALENFDAVGKWRELDEMYRPIDTSGALPSGTKFRDLAEFRQGLVGRPDRFASTVTERLFVYGLGRGLEYSDMPSVRRIVREAAPGDYSLVSLIKGIVKSDPFLMRRSELTPGTVAAARE